MATAEPAPPYDDGSSTESEYYFDPAEEAEELAAYAWEHALDASAPPNQPEVAKLNDNIAIKQEFSDYRSASDGSDEIALPQGSEWSHGAGCAAVCDDAVERALAMASRFEREMRKAQGNEALTADTLNGNDHEHEQDEEPPGEIKQKDKTVMRSLSSTNSREVKVKMKPKIVSLKSVKTSTLPASATNSVVVGLRRPPAKVVGAPSELERGLSVARSQWKATDNQKASPMNSKTSQAKSEEIKVAARKRGEQGKSPSISMGSTELEKVSSRRRTEHSEPPDKSTPSRPDAYSNSQPRHQSRSPSKDQTERPTRTDRSKSLARHRSRSRSRRREENERRSRSPYRSTVSVSPRSRSRRHDDSSSRSRNENESKRRSNHRDERSRSPPRYLRYESRSGSRCRDRELNDHHEGSRQIRQDNGRVEHARHDVTEKGLDPRNRKADTSRENQHNKKDADGYHRQDSHRTQTARASDKKEVQVLSKQGSDQTKSRCDAKNREGPIGRNRDRGASKPRLDKSDSVRPRPASNVLTNPTAGQATKRSPKDPRARAQVGMNASHQNTSKKPSTFRHIIDDFERKVHKLKLREADLNEKEAAQTPNRRDSRNFGNRRRGIAVEKAQLEAQDLERFEKLYESMTVSKEELARYQTRREFAYRVVCYKRKQAALQEQTGGQAPEETAMHWRLLDEERERLVRENSELFHDVMIGQHELGRTYIMRGKRSGPRKPEKRSRSSDAHDGQPFLKRIARGLNAAHRQLDVSSSSRVVAGASLRHRSEDKPLPPQSSNTPWFLKG